MASSASISRTQLVYGLCLPVAALIGFFLADPLRFGSMTVLGLVLTVLVWPLFARWHHPLLVASLHSAFVLAFLPGGLPLWMPVALGGFFIVVFRRCLDPSLRLFPPGGVAWALIALGCVIVVTAWVRGGVGLRMLGSDSMGGKKYVFLIVAIMAYFVIVSQPVERKHAKLYFGLYCLMGLTSLLSHAAYSAGFYWAFNILDVSPAVGQAAAEWSVQGNTVFRSTATMNTAGALIGFMLGCIGLRETLNLKKPWRLLFLLGCLAVGALGGFRSFLISMGLMLAIFFVMEGLHRTRYLVVVLAVGLVGFAGLAAFSERLPLSVQRTISFLPVPIDSRAMQDAQGSLDWRHEMWRALWQEVPQYAMLGKGYSIDPNHLFMSGFNEHFGYGLRAEWAILAGEYHNGPLSVVITFGVFGVAAFVWFLVAGTRRLFWFCRHGADELVNINRALCIMFVTKIIFFIFLFGALNSDLVEFVMLVALAECLNAPDLQTVESEEEPAMDMMFGEGGRP